MNLLEELTLARQLSFSPGKVELLRQPIVIVPSDMLGIYTSKINDDSRLASAMYFSAKKAITVGFGSYFKDKTQYSFKNFDNWFIDIGKLSGWCILRWDSIDKDKHLGTISADKAPLGSYLAGRVRRPCDHFLRGFVAAGASIVFNRDVDAVETQCIGMKDKQCRFVIDSNENLKANFSELYGKQLKL